MKLLSIEPTDHTADIRLLDGSVWQATHVDEAILAKLSEELPEETRPQVTAEYI